MQRAALKLLVFTLGVVLAFGLAYASQLLSASTAASRENDVPTPSAPIRVLPPATPQIDREAQKLRILSPEARASLIEQVAEEGTLQSLRILSPKTIKAVPDYKTTVLPIVKDALLRGLLARFSENDWTDWPRSSFAVNDGPTPARAYADDVRLINPDLGRYLETSAHLFHSLYLKTMQGGHVNLREELYTILRNAEKLLAYRRTKAIPARQMFDPEILNEPIFLREFERKRRDFIMFFISEHPNDLEAQLSLLLSVNADVASQEIFDALSELLRRFALSGSPRFREHVLQLTADGANVREIVLRDAKVRRALAELYLVGVVDALEDHDQRHAVIYLNESVAIQPGLRAQDVLAQSIKQETDALVRDSKENPQPEEEAAPAPTSAPNEDELFVRGKKGDSETAAHGSGISFLFIFVVLFFGAVIGGGFLLYRRRMELSAIAHYEPPPEQRPAPVRMTPPSSVEFEEELASKIVGQS